MRQPGRRDRSLQLVLAALLALPLLAAFFGGGGFADVYGAYQSGVGPATVARQLALAAALGRSLLIGVLAAALAAALGVPAGWALAQTPHPASTSFMSGLLRKGRGTVAALVLAALPLALPPSVAVSGWVGLLAPAGAASRFNVPIPGFGPESRGWLFSSLGAAFVLGLSFWPVVALEVWPAFKRARASSAYDAALLYGSRSRSFWRVVLPQARGELASGALLVFLLASSDFTVSSLLLVRTLPIEIHDALASGRTASAAWAAVPLLIMVFAVAALLYWRTPSPCPLPAGERAGGSGARAPVGTAFLSAGVLLGFLVPMLVCLQQALAGGKPMTRVFGAGSEALLVSLRLAGAAAALAAVLAVLRAVLWPEMRARALNAAALFLLAAPGSFLAAAVLAVQVSCTGTLTPYEGNALAEAVLAGLPAAALTFGYVVRFIYLPLRLVEEGLAGLDPEMLDAAALSGHGRISRGVAIALPLVAAHVAAAAALVFVLVLGEVAMADKLHPPGVTPATVWLFQQQHLGYDEAVFGLSLLLGAVAAAALLVAGLLVTGLSTLFGRVNGGGDAAGA